MLDKYIYTFIVHFEGSVNMKCSKFWAHDMIQYNVVE
jgi:hypothetical protein